MTDRRGLVDNTPRSCLECLTHRDLPKKLCFLVAGYLSGIYIDKKYDGKPGFQPLNASSGKIFVVTINLFLVHIENHIKIYNIYLPQRLQEGTRLARDRRTSRCKGAIHNVIPRSLN